MVSTPQIDKVFVSIVCSTYNNAKYIKECVDSVLTQTYKNFEFILVNNGSTDNTSKILESYNDSRLKIITLDINDGAPLGFNTAIKNISNNSDYVAYICGDDVWLPTKLEKQINALNDKYDDNTPKYLASCTWYNLIDDNSNVIPENAPLYDYFNNRSTLTDRAFFLREIYFFNKMSFTHSSFIIERNLFNKIHNINISDASGDILLYINTLLNSNMYIINDVLLSYRQTSNQESRNKFFDNQLRYEHAIVYDMYASLDDVALFFNIAFELSFMVPQDIRKAKHIPFYFLLFAILTKKSDAMRSAFRKMQQLVNDEKLMAELRRDYGFTYLDWRNVLRTVSFENYNIEILPTNVNFSSDILQKIINIASANNVKYKLLWKYIDSFCPIYSARRDFFNGIYKVSKVLYKSIRKVCSNIRTK